MSLTIGRIAVADGTQDWAVSGDTVALSGDWPAGDLDELAAAGLAIQGLAGDRDESFVPVIWTDLPEMSGFYRVRTADWQVVSLNDGGLADWRVVLERPQGFQRPVFETRVLSVVRANTIGIVDSETELWFGIPGTAEGSAMATTRPLAAGGTIGLVAAAYTSVGADWTDQWRVDVADYYDGAARIEASPDGGTTWYPIVGRWFPPGWDWRITNDHTRVAGASTGGECIFTLSRWDGSAWTTPKTYQATNGAVPSTMATEHTVVVLRNAPDTVAIRVVGEGGTGADLTLDLTLRRGSAFVDCRVTGTNAQGVRREAAEAATQLTPAFATASTVPLIRATTATSGDKYVIMTAGNGNASTEITVDTTQGGIRTTAVTAGSYSFGVSLELDGGAAGSWEQTTGGSRVGLYEQWTRAVDVTTRLLTP